MQLSIHKRYLRTNTQNTIVVNSISYEFHIRRKCSNLEIYLLPPTDTVQLPVNGPCKSRNLAINVICTTVSSLNIQLYDCIAVFPRLHPNTTYMPNTDDTDYTDNRVVFIIWTHNVNAICTTTMESVVFSPVDINRRWLVLVWKIMRRNREVTNHRTVSISIRTSLKI